MWILNFFQYQKKWLLGRNSIGTPFNIHSEYGHISRFPQSKQQWCLSAECLQQLPDWPLLASFHSLTIPSSLRSFALAFPYLQSISPPDAHVACFLTLFMSLINYHLLHKACPDILILNCKQIAPHTNSLLLLQCPAFFSLWVSS